MVACKFWSSKKELATTGVLVKGGINLSNMEKGTKCFIHINYLGIYIGWVHKILFTG